MQPIATSTIHELISDFLFLASLWQVKSVELIFWAPAGTINFKVRYNIRYVLFNASSFRAKNIPSWSWRFETTGQKALKPIRVDTNFTQFGYHCINIKSQVVKATFKFLFIVKAKGFGNADMT